MASVYIHRPQFSHMTTLSYKGGWEMHLSILHVPNTELDACPPGRREENILEAYWQSLAQRALNISRMPEEIKTFIWALAR